jgi:hypothetical protein
VNLTCTPTSNPDATRVSKSAPKTATDNKFRRYRQQKLRRQLEKSGEAFLHTECLFCDKPIKPSYRRAFCKGRVCRGHYLKAKPVHRVVPITRLDRLVSTRIVAGVSL